MQIRYYILIVVIVAGAGYGIGRYLQPAQIEIKEIEVVKEIEVIKKDVVTVIKEVERPDGSKERHTTIEDRSRETTKKESEKETSTTIVNEKPQWRAQALLKLNNVLTLPVYGAGIERRIVGPFSAGVWATTDRNIGVSASFEF